MALRDRSRVLALKERVRGRPRVAALDSLARARGCDIRPASHHPASTVAALLLIGWLASQIGWTLEPARISSAEPLAGCVEGEARAGERRLALSLRSAPELEVPGLAGVALASESGLRLALDRGPGGLRARRRDPDGEERTWKLLGASRGEGGILGEGIRAALLRDPTYTPALRAAQAMLPEETHADAVAA